MAGDPNPHATWRELREANIDGVYNIFVAAKAAGCRRVIHASSIHAVSGYPPDVQVKTSEPVNPGDLYGVSKCFGEALARYMAVQEGLSAITLRIGAFQPLESIAQHLRARGVGLVLAMACPPTAVSAQSRQRCHAQAAAGQATDRGWSAYRTGAGTDADDGAVFEPDAPMPTQTTQLAISAKNKPSSTSVEKTRLSKRKCI